MSILIPLDELITKIPQQNGKDKIFTAFLELIKTTPYQKIKVSSLIEKAQVNRSTFYRYYNDIMDYYKKICAVCISCLLVDIDKCFEDTRDIEKCFSDVERLIDNRIENSLEIIRLLSGKNGSCDFFSDFRYYFLNTVDRIFSKKGIYNIEENEVVEGYVNLIFICQLSHVLGSIDLTSFEQSGFQYDPKINILDNISLLATGRSDEKSASIVFSLGKLVLEKGLRFCTVNNIMKFAGYSRTEFYSYFPNTDSAVIHGVASACYVMTQIVVSLAVCECDRVDDFLTPEDYGNTFVGEDEIIDLLQKCDHFYFFLAWCCRYSVEKLEKMQREKSGTLTSSGQRGIVFFVTNALSQLVNYAQKKDRDAVINSIVKAKTKLAENGVCL